VFRVSFGDSIITVSWSETHLVKKRDWLPGAGCLVGKTFATLDEFMKQLDPFARRM
jgi:hypothetical protein